MRFLQPLLLLVALLPGLASALGLGRLDLQSALNEPFNARIELVSATVDELDSLNVSLADESAFQRAGIPYTRVLSELRFSVKETEAGPDYIQIYTNDPVREPYLDFLIEISWSKGRLYREYTALLDPPIYSDLKTQQKLSQHAPTAKTTGTVIHGIEDNHVVYNPEYTKTAPAGARAPVARTINYGGGDYGPVVTGDTLWSIASAARPDTSVSIQQMMLALLRTNPEAFINNNINGLKRGQVLHMPDMSDIKSVSKDDAFSQSKMQNELWEEARGAMATTVSPRPEGTAQPTAEQPSTGAESAPAKAAGTMPETEPELRLVAPTEGGKKTMGQGGEADTKALQQELALVNESLEALKLENSDLKDKLSETEAIVDDLKRLIALKENELAALQQQIAKAKTEKAAAEKKRAQAAPQTTQPKPEQKPAAKVQQKAEMKQPPAPAKPAEKAPAAKPAPAKPETAEAPSTSLIPFDLSGLVEIIRSNTLYLLGALGGVILVLIAIVFVKRRQSQTAAVIPESAFPEFTDLEVESEAITDISPSLEEEEAETILPGEDETIAPEFVEDKTQVVTPQTAPKATPAPEAPAPAPEAEEEEDPLAEVNVFLAYEHFDQAEEFVKQALEKEPDNLEFHTKLLEVYYAANNKKGYEEEARVLHDKVNGEGEYWNMAVAMWQEISPNRDLFAEPVAGEEEDTGLAASGGGGGIVNIAGEEGAAAKLDLDLDTTAAPGEEIAEVEATEESPDILDVTAAVDSGEDVLDVTAAVNMEEAEAEPEEESLEMEPSEEDEILDISAASDDEDEVLDISASGADEGLDVSLGAETEEAPAADEGLDFSLDMETEEAPADEGLDFALDTDEEAAPQEEEGLDMSLDMETEEAPADEGLDFSLDTGEEAAPQEEEGLDMSLDMETEEAPADEGLDLSLDTGEEAAPQEEEDLDVSLDLTKDTEKSDNETPADEGADILDVTSAFNLDGETGKDTDESAGEGILDVSKGAVNDLLDVTKSNNLDLDNDEDLLDVTTSATQAGMDAGELLDEEKESETGADESTPDLSDSGLDFEIAPDASAEKGDADTELTFAGIDITTDEEPEEDKPDESKDKDFEINMESTMQIPKRAAVEEEPEEADESDEEFNIVMDEEDADDDHTIMVPRSTSAGEQSDEDEIATQLDLAKAYVELGDTDNAKTILNEIIAVGNAEQKNQAQEMLDQLS